MTHLPPTTILQLSQWIAGIFVNDQSVVVVIAHHVGPEDGTATRAGYYISRIGLFNESDPEEGSMIVSCRQLLTESGHIYTREGNPKWYRNLESVRIDVAKLFVGCASKPVRLELRVPLERASGIQGDVIDGEVL